MAYFRFRSLAHESIARTARIFLIICVAILHARLLPGWEGHDWNEWRRVTTWKRPELQTDQAGRADLAPLLGETKTASGDSVAALRDWEARSAQYSQVIQAILGEPTALKKPPAEARELGAEDLGDYTRRHVLIRAEPDDWIPAYLLTPKKLPEPRAPAMICLHQTVAQGKDEPCGIKGDPELAYALELVKRGYVCIAPDAIGFGERITSGAEPYHDSIAFYRKHPQWSFMGKMIWDVSRVVDYLETLPVVDSARIGCIGHSHGAYGGLFAAAFEPRIKAVVASCGFTTLRSDPNPERWSHLTALIPQLGFYLPQASDVPFDWQHVLALIAPRRLFVWYATKDAIFPRTENLSGLLADVKNVYTLDGKPDALAWDAFDGPHQFPKQAREKAYRWLEEGFSKNRANSKLRVLAGASTGSDPASAALKPASAFFPAPLVARAQSNAKNHAWAATIRDSLVAAAKPWMELSDDHLWSLMFGNTIKRAWQVWSNGYCPSCKNPVPMYEWVPDALNHPWKLRCPKCGEYFPKNDFQRFYESGLNQQGLFLPDRADRSLLFNADHPDPSDPLHKFGVDDGEGYVEGDKRWRFINYYLIFGQWKQAIVGGIHNLAAAYVATGDAVYARKAGILLDRLADFYPTFDFGKEGVMYEGPPRSGYVSTWHDACVEALDLALSYDAVFEGMAHDSGLVEFLAAKSAQHHLDAPKTSFAIIQRNIEEHVFRDTLNNRPKIESNYPMTDVTNVTLHTVLDWPRNRAEVMTMLDAIIAKATAVDGLTGEKGIAGYSVIAPQMIAALLGRYARNDPQFLGETLQRHPPLRDMYRFHIDTWCLGLYYPRTGDTGAFAERNPSYAGLAFTKNPGINPSSYAFLWELFKATGDKDFVRVLYGANANSAEGLPFDLFAANPGEMQAETARVIAESGSEIKLASVNKTEWGLAILRSGADANARAAWLDYDSGERHGHADGMTIGLFAHGLDLLPDFGYPPVQFGGWTAPRAVWYTQTASHNTISVDRKNTAPGSGKTTLWFDGVQFHAVRAAAPKLIGGTQFERLIALLDISEKDSYLLDIFRVAGGSEHTRFTHGHFGKATVAGLTLEKTEQSPYGEVMRNFNRDPAPSPGWSADWSAQDYLKFLPPGSDVHLRLTDITRDAAVQTAETWVAVGRYGGTADAWIPSVLVTRRADHEPLASTFVSVMDPYEAKSNVFSVRGLQLCNDAGETLSDDVVGVEIRLADGRRDIIVSTSNRPAGEGTEGSTRPSGPVVLEKEYDLKFDGDFCILRYDAQGRIGRMLFSRGASLRAGNVRIQSKDVEANVELDLSNRQNPIIAGPPNTVDLVEVAGVRLWPR